MSPGVEGFVPEDFEVGGRCWPPHPILVDEDNHLLILDLGEAGDFSRVAESLEDLQMVHRVLSGEITRDELLASWGMLSNLEPTEVEDLELVPA